MRMSMVVKIGCTVIALMFLAGVSASFSQPMLEGGGPKGFHDKGREGAHARLSERLGLTKEQEDKLRDNRKENLEVLRKLRDQMKEARNALHEELQRPVSDDKKVELLVLKMKDAQAQMIDQRVDNFLEMKEILSPEQFEKFISLKDDFKKRHKEMMRHMRDKRNRRKEWGMF